MAPATRAAVGAKAGIKKKAASKAPAAKVTKPTKLTNSSKSAKALKTTKVANALTKSHDDRQRTATPEIQVLDRPPAQGSMVAFKPMSLKTTTETIGKVVVKYSTSTVGNSASYNEDAGLYVLNSHTESRKPFALEPITIQSGDYKGYQALVLVPIPKKRFQLEDLPAELRRLIYKEAFATKGLELRAQGRVRGQTLGALVKPGSRWDNKPRRKTLAPFNTSLLRVSRQMFEEAAHEFYSTDIHVCGWKGLSFFLESIGSCRRFVQSIVVNSDYHGYNAYYATAAARYLAEATSLKKLQLRGDVYPAWVSNSEWVAGDLKPLLKKLHEKGKSVEDILKIVVLDIHQYCQEHDPNVPRSMHFWHYHEDSDEDCEDCARIKHRFAIPMNEMKAKIVAVLEEEEPEPAPKRKPVARLGLKPELATRRDTGRPKREGITDKVVSYAESDDNDNEMEDIVEDIEEDGEDDMDF